MQGEVDGRVQGNTYRYGCQLTDSSSDCKLVRVAVMGRHAHRITYDKEMLVKNIRMLMIAKDVMLKEIGVPYGVIDSKNLDKDVYLGYIVQIAEALDVSIDTLIYTDISKKLMRKENRYGNDSY